MAAEEGCRDGRGRGLGAEKDLPRDGAAGLRLHPRPKARPNRQHALRIACFGPTNRSAPGAEPNGVRGIGRLQDRLVLLAPGGCHSNLRFFTRGSVIGGESISLRAFAVINQTAV
jgi:hypothetical protein